MAQDQDVPKGAWWTEPSVVKALNLKENEIEQLEKAYWEYKSIIMNLNNQVSTDQLEIDSRKAKNSFNPQRKERIIRELKGKVKSPLYAEQGQSTLCGRGSPNIGPERLEKLANLEY